MKWPASGRRSFFTRPFVEGRSLRAIVFLLGLMGGGEGLFAQQQGQVPQGPVPVPGMGYSLPAFESIGQPQTIQPPPVMMPSVPPATFTPPEMLPQGQLTAPAQDGSDKSQSPHPLEQLIDRTSDSKALLGP
jgi:hypothetical protein